MENLPEKIVRHVFPAMLILSMLFNLSTYGVYYKRIFLHRAKLIKGISLWRQTSHGLGYPKHSQDKADSIMSTSIKNGLYLPPS